MRTFAVAVVALIACGSAQAQQASQPPAQPVNALLEVAPALEKYGRERVVGDLWQRPGLGPRDRSGWPNVFSVLPVVKEVFEKRPS